MVYQHPCPRERKERTGGRRFETDRASGIPFMCRVPYQADPRSLVRTTRGRQPQHSEPHHAHCHRLSPRLLGEYAYHMYCGRPASSVFAGRLLRGLGKSTRKCLIRTLIICIKMSVRIVANVVVWVVWAACIPYLRRMFTVGLQAPRSRGMYMPNCDLICMIGGDSTCIAGDVARLWRSSDFCCDCRELYALHSRAMYLPGCDLIYLDSTCVVEIDCSCIVSRVHLFRICKVYVSAA